MLEQIKASAGSGKTYTLTRRFLEELCRLGDADAEPACRRQKAAGPGAFSEILAMTFTNKAAAEMKARVLAALKAIALAPGNSPDEATGISPARARAWLSLILRRYDSLNIRTIDSLLNLLMQISAVNLDIPPDFELAFDEAEFLDPLYDELLDQADQGNEEIRALLGECADYLLNASRTPGLTPRGRIRAMLLDVLGKLQSAPLRPCADKDKLEEKRDQALDEIYTALHALEIELERLNLTPGKYFRTFMENLLAYTPGQKFPESKSAWYASFADCCNKAEKALVDDALELAYGNLQASLGQNKNKLALYQSALDLLPFTRLSLLLLPQIKRLQHESGKIPASLKEALAGEVLNAENGVAEACCRLGSRLSHILIDEFQDTSRAQWQAILPLAEECLSRGGSLRYVGDVKQAIYSWRGGDSSLFDEIIEPDGELTAMAPAPMLTKLPYNWRSSPEVVRQNNEFFSRLAEPEKAYNVIKALLHKDYPDDYAREAAAALARAFKDTVQALPPAGGPARPRGYVRLERVSGSNKAGLYDDIKQKLHSLFQELLQRHEPGDIALLVRKGEEANTLADWLAEWGIAVVTEHSFKLESSPLVRRLVALLRWLDYPPDDLSFLSFISGQEIFGRSSGLGPHDVLRWEASACKRGGAQPLFRSFKKDYPAEWSLWLEPFYRRSGLMSAYDTVSEIYNRYSLLASSPGHAVYLRRFLELVLAAEKAGHSSLSSFLEFWGSKGREEKIPAPENPGAVRLMTIHKSKGLEFKVVVMPFHRFSGRGEVKPTLCAADGLPLLVKDGPYIGQDYYRAKNNSAVEVMNMLYVAWTRAGEELHIFAGGSDDDHTKAGFVKALNFLLDDYTFSKDGVYSAGAPGRPAQSPALAGPQEAPAFMPVPPPDDEDWQPMGWLPKLKIFRAPIPEQLYDERVRGILFHNCLENLYIPDNTKESAEALVTRAVDSTLRGFQLPAGQAQSARAELIRALLWFCSLPQARHWLKNGRSEQSIMDEAGASHRMDMLVEEENASLLVLEYKTGRPRPEHREQIVRYLRLLAATGKKTRGILVYLDEERLEEVDYE